MKIGFIGLGTMGSRMATNLIKQGHTLIIHDMLKANAQSLIAQGAQWAETPAALGVTPALENMGRPTAQICALVVCGSSGASAPEALASEPSPLGEFVFDFDWHVFEVAFALAFARPVSFSFRALALPPLLPFSAFIATFLATFSRVFVTLF